MNLLFAILGLTAVGLGAMGYVERRRSRRNTETLVDDLLAAAESPKKRIVRKRGFVSLPAPIRRYLEHVLRNEEPCVQTVRVEQRGTFRSGNASSPWNSFTATQHVTTQPPGFVWDATIDLFPGIPVRVVDAYRDGRGLLRATLGDLLSVANPTPGPELAEGELLRYLAEAPLYPTALLPGMGVSWTAINEQSARATLTHRGTTASLAFHVNDRDEVERVTGKRPFLTNDGTYEARPWKGTWRNYEHRDGLRVPTKGEVAWIRREGQVSYWRGHMERLEYQFGAPVPAEP